MGKKKTKKMHGKKYIIALVILLCLCGILYGLSETGVIPVKVVTFEDDGIHINFEPVIAYWNELVARQKDGDTSDGPQASQAEPHDAHKTTEPAISLADKHSSAPDLSSTSTAMPENLELPLCPSGSNDHETRIYTGFTACYREDYEQPEWVCYTITPEKLVKETERSNNFKSDPQISTGSATPDDYKSSGYDRGHLAPAADMAYSETTMKESFYMSNMSPQAPSFNRGIWNNLENDVRSIAAGCDCLYVVTGPILEKPASEYGAIGKNNVSIPEFYYKVLLAVNEDEATGIRTLTSYAYIVPNGKTDEKPEAFLCAIDDVENRTGIDFFSLLEDSLEDQLETGVNITR